MVEQVSEISAAAKRSGGLRTLIAIGLGGFLLGAAAVGYGAWRDGIDLFDLGGAASPNADMERPAGLAGGRAGKPGRNDSTNTALQLVASQQGGIEQRVSALEQRIARLDLQAAAVEGNTARAEGLLVAFAARRAIERGAPLGYLADQLRLRFGDSKPNAVAIVIDAADHPVTLDKLEGRLSALSSDLQESDKETGLAWLRRELGELFVIRRESAPSPQPAKRLDRARMFLESGRVEAAIAEVQNMPGASEATEWIADANRYALAERALDLLETSAILDTHGLRDGEGRLVAQPSPAGPNP